MSGANTMSRPTVCNGEESPPDDACGSSDGRFIVAGPGLWHGAEPAAGPPQRTVSGHTLTSTAGPRVQIRFDDAFTYAGVKTFLLYGVAAAEQHLFVDADAGRRVRRLYWVQFERYLPDNDHQYDYDDGETVQVGGLPFVSHSAPRRVDEPRPHSDGAYARELLAGAGYVLPVEILWQRLVHLTDESRREELMIIYTEDLSPAGLTAADLEPGGRAASRWPATKQALLQRAQAGLTIVR
jgi:hypothetical protein